VALCLQGYSKKIMKTIIVGALVCAAVAGVVYYLYNQDEVESQLSDLKDKASDALDKAKTKFSRQADAVETWAQS
jgi:uncharacterized membrane-anchored protein YhcB (DUF1043 family)